MTDKEKIRVEIVRRMKGECPIICSYIIYEDILNFIDSMQEEPVSEDLKEEITRYFSKNPIKHLTDWPALKNTALHFAYWQKKQKNIWHTMDETPNYPCDILFLTNVGSMFLYRYMENGRPVDRETPHFHNILNGKCWCYCSDVVNE